MKPIHMLSFFLFLIGFLTNSYAQTVSATPDDQADVKFWNHDDLHGLDPWGDASADSRDIIALYSKQMGDSIYFRVDYLDLRLNTLMNLYLAIDFRPKGNFSLTTKGNFIQSDVAWDLLAHVTSSGVQQLLDTSFQVVATLQSFHRFDHLDYVEFSIPSRLFAGWIGSPFTLQALEASDDSSSILDKTLPASSNATTGRGKMVIVFENMFGSGGPNEISAYEGYSPFGAGLRPGELRGYKYLLDATRKYGIPLTVSDLRIDALPSTEYLTINDTLRDLESRGLVDILGKATYGYFMPWQPADVNAKMLTMSRQFRKAFDFKDSRIFYPYEGMLRVSNLQSIKDAGYTAVFAGDRYAYYVGEDGWVADPAIKQKIREGKKIHRFNGVTFFFDTRVINDEGIEWDQRWNSRMNPDGQNPYYNDFVIHGGTDNGLHQWWRSILMDMALDSDQEMYFAIGGDFNLTPWCFKDILEQNYRWLASHPWIEVATLTDLLTRNWKPIDHGILPLSPNDALPRYQLKEDWHYNAHFWDSYYGAIADGHSHYVPQGTKIEAYFDYIPYLRNGQRIPSGRKMGDDTTQGTIIYETLKNLRTMPNNGLSQLAWQHYFIKIAEQTFHSTNDVPNGGSADFIGGAYLHPVAKYRANHLSQVNKIVAAARWADDAAKGKLSNKTQLIKQDLDLDGEDEYVLQNDKIFATFSSDGGRMDYAFAYNASKGAIQSIAPYWQFDWEWSTTFFDGKKPIPNTLHETAFEDGDYGQTNKYRYDFYTPAASNDTLTFLSSDGCIHKSFTLSGDSISAHYSLSTLSSLPVGFGLPVTIADMFVKDWWVPYKKINSTSSIGYQYGDNTLANINLQNINLQEFGSFLDSPARVEMRSRPNTIPYPSGHFQRFPYGYVFVNGSNSFDVNLRLSAGNSFSPPILERSVSFLTFGNVSRDSLSSKKVIITNPSSSQLVIDSIYTRTPKFKTSIAKASVNIAESLKINVQFAPIVYGVFNDTLFLHNNSLSPLSSIPLSGVSPLPLIAIATYLVDYGQIGQFDSLTKSVTVFNKSVNQASIQSISLSTNVFALQGIVPTSIKGTDSIMLHIQCKPTKYGNYADTLLIASDGGTAKIALQANCPASFLAVLPQSINFGNVRNDTVSVKSLAMTNNSVSLLTIDSLRTSSIYFVASTIIGNKSIRTGDTLKTSLQFIPSPVKHNYNDTLLIYNNSSLAPPKVPIVGASPYPILISTKTLIDLGSVGVYDSSKATVKFTNTSINALIIDTAFTSTPSFSASLKKGSIKQGDSLSVTVTFSMFRFGSYADTLVIKDNAEIPIFRIPLKAYTPPAFMVINPQKLSFGKVKKDTLSQLLVSIVDTSISRLAVDSLLTGTKYFEIFRTLANKFIKKGDTVTTSIRFKPDTLRVYSDTLYIFNSSLVSPFKIPLDGNGVLTSAQEATNLIPDHYFISQNYPNPFNPSTVIEYGLPAKSIVRLQIFNILGQRVATLYNGEESAGYQKLQWNADVSTGIYFYRIDATSVDDPTKHFVDTKKMLLLR